MTALQCLGLIAVCSLLADLVHWTQWSRAPQAQRPRRLRLALGGLGYPAALGGLWAFLWFSPGARSAGLIVPWWVTAIVVLGVLIFLGLVLAELRLTLSLRREGI